ncbi:mycbp-associated protein-like isoform x4 [Plakobranchus ocellatus]|uniref:Mycbp-associated protein-like isoform x4 n=1 Tax=Plakobranchus ocellatus TaxID=259542 RepID=A0AAV4DUU5_9GAST|nr:mycbp-associated protein-like isoform x4 [Plakobranchus ocellatus]
MASRSPNKLSPHGGAGRPQRRMSVFGGQNRLRKKRDGTPEKSATPSQEPDENLAPSRNVIWNEEIEKLQIKADDLSKPPSTEKKMGTTRPVVVQKSKKEADAGKPKSRMVSVAKPAPPDAPVKPFDYSGFAGPKYDEQGEVIPHSLLGTYEDFHREATRRGDILAVIISLFILCCVLNSLFFPILIQDKVGIEP